MSKKILNITTNTEEDIPYNITLSKAILKKLQVRFPESQLFKHELPKYLFPDLEAQSSDSSRRTPGKSAVEKKIAVKYSSKAFAELLQTDIIVMSLFLKNFDTPNILRLWIDFVIREYETFRYTDEFPVDLVTNKKVYLVITSTGNNKKDLIKKIDFTESYLKTVLNFVGITDITTYRVEGSDYQFTEKALLRTLNTVNDTIF